MPTLTENEEDLTGTEILTIRSRTKNKEDPIGTKILMTRSRTEIELPTKNLCSIKILAVAEIAKSMNIGQISYLEYPIIDSPSIELVVDGKLLDKIRTHLFKSIGIFCLFIEIISNEE
jgi:hypothetical protein